MTKPRYLTKSRFKLALDCPTKLFYTKKKEYENLSLNDSFLEGLAQGGFQVEELARMNYPDGIAILGNDYNYNALVEETNKLLQQENVVLFEPAFLVDGLFIRVDILEKKGNSIKLIEVKAKSIDSESHENFITKNGIGGGMNSYLYDVAFQKYVIQRSYPNWQITPYLNLVDKSKQTTVSGLNQMFRIVTNSEFRTGIEKKEGLTKADLGDSILALINVGEEINLILNENPVNRTISFIQLVDKYKEAYAKDEKIKTSIGLKCKGCEFKSTTTTSNLKSGFHECWKEQLNLSIEEINRPKAYDVWFNPAKKVLADNRYFMDEITEDDFTVKPVTEGISRTERQQLQIDKTITHDASVFVDQTNLEIEMSAWVYPLNFIDFETTAVALPFTRGMRPYEQLAFQFSHHTIDKNGIVEHANEYLNTDIGVFPNFDFIRALKKALETNNGTIFRYHNHENTIVNVIYNQLKVSQELDKIELMQFIQSISHSSSQNADYWKGNRDMIDLQRTIINNYYNPITGGSNSIKAILPAILESSLFLKEKYSNTIENVNLTSLNFPKDYVFVEYSNGKPSNPYKTLPPLFDNLDLELLEKALTQNSDALKEINDGGAALFAYARLQNDSVSSLERKETQQALLRYCELDTLAMVMIYEHFKELISK